MLIWIQVVLFFVGLLSGGGGAASAAGGAERDDETVLPRASEPRTFKDAAELLTALEIADRDIRTFASEIRYTRLFEIQGDVQTRIGKLYFKTDPPRETSAAANDSGMVPARRRWVAVRFTEMIVGGRRDKQEQVWVFDGEWLVEKNPTERQFIKRRMVRSGETYDPLRVGEGPFFVPVGQKREDMEVYFTAELREVSDGLSDAYDESRDAMLRALGRNLEGTVQLMLTPKPGLRQVQDFALIRVWYDARTLLPRASMSIDPLGDIDVFELFRVDVNETREKIGADVFSVETPGAGEGYHVEVMDETRR